MANEGETYLYIDPKVPLMEAHPTFLPQQEDLNFGPVNGDIVGKMTFVERLHNCEFR